MHYKTSSSSLSFESNQFEIYLCTVASLNVDILDRNAMNDRDTDMADNKFGTHFTDLNSDCLERIFEYLPIGDLVNLAEADVFEYYILGKGKIIKGQSGEYDDKADAYNRSMRYSFARKMRSEQRISVSMRAKYAPFCINLLRHFGPQITCLNVDYFLHRKDGSSYSKAVENAINDNCRETLAQIEFSNCDPLAFNAIQGPFPNVKFVSFSYCHLGKKLDQLVKWFPSMESLELKYSNFFPEYIYHRFPFLEQFTVYNSAPNESNMIFTNENLKTFAIFNPQLKSLSILNDGVQKAECGVIVNWNLMSSLSRTLRQLSCLKLNLIDYQKEWLSLVFGKLVTLEIKLAEFDTLDKIKITSPKLNNLILIGAQDQPNCRAIIEFIKRLRPAKLIIQNKTTFDIGDDYLQRIAEALDVRPTILVKDSSTDPVHLF